MTIIMVFFNDKLYANDEKVLTFSNIEKIPHQIISEKILKDIYAKLKIETNIIEYPGLRGIEETYRGRSDGEIARALVFGKQNPMYTRIDPAVNYISLMAFSKNKNIKVDGLKSLNEYRIGLVKGTFYSKNFTQSSYPVTLVASIEQLAQMTQLGRIDLFIADEFGAKVALKRTKLDKEIFELLNPIEEKIGLYHYINKKYKNTISKVEKIFREMEKNGEINSLREKYKQEMLDNLK